MAVISDREVRALIADYYREYDGEHVRIDERETAYPHISYQLVPRSVGLAEEGHADESYLEPGLGDEYINELVKAVHESSIGRHVIAEINLARFVQVVTLGYQVRAADLIARLKEYQTEIE